jgi:diaminopimelate decarboxylase
MATAQALVSKYFAGSRNDLVAGGVPVAAIAAAHGTPFFAYDAGVFDQKWVSLRTALPNEFGISYSMKANPLRPILEFFLVRGCGLEIASDGEFHQALAAGCKPEHVIFAGPGKTEAQLELVLSLGIGEIHAESTLEIERIGRIARRLSVPARVALRINPNADAQGGAMRMGGKPAPFGVDEEELDAVLDLILSDRVLSFRGIHLFSGTQILDCKILLAQYRKGLELAGRVADRLGRPLDTLDFGGGLGVPYFAQESELDMNGLREGLGEIFGEVRRDRRYAGTQFLVEPGRYLAAEAGLYITRVSDIKTSRGKKFLIVDGGMNHHLAASGNLGQTIKRNYPLALVNKLWEPAEETVDVVGPLCTPLDVLARNIDLPRAQVGDLICVFQSGAYSRSASPLGFLSHPTPPEVWLEAGQQTLVRSRGDYNDFVRDLCPSVPVRA